MADLEFPKTLYKNGGERVVASLRAYHQARFDGWTDEPRAAKSDAKADEAKVSDAKPEQAEELGGQKPVDPSKVAVKNEPTKPNGS